MARCYLLFVPESRAALTTIEYEGGAVGDLRAGLERLAPRDMSYTHDRRWGDGNEYDHMRAALLGLSLAIPRQTASCCLALGAACCL